MNAESSSRGRFDPSDPQITAPIAIAVMVSGHSRGSNLGAILAACADGRIHGRVTLVIGTRADSPALERGRKAGAAVTVVSPKKYEGDETGYSAALLRALERENIQLICLAGYMRKIPSQVVQVFAGKIMNIHPALLPLFGGRGMFGEHVHRAALDSGMKISGCTVHFVDEQYDTGPIIVQVPVPIEEEDSPSSLAGRVLSAEHEAYVRAVRLFAAGRLQITAGRVRIAPAAEP